MDHNIQIYGIRHHGAGSSRSMLEALALQNPDVILIECPADCQHLIPFVSDALITPPAAILVYDKQDPHICAYYPFTLFSPEWQGMLFATKTGAEIRFMDLPQGISFYLKEQDETPPKVGQLIRDPFAYMADIAGYDDPERWWDTYIEQQGSPPEIFKMIQHLMSELRLAGGAGRPSNLIREAHMRMQLRQALRDGYKNIAVVCGAWHSPALDHATHSASDDRKLLKGLTKKTTSATWVPWSYNRIARHSGYSSGVISPYWYEALFTNPEKAVATWMSRAGSILNEMGHSISPAHVIESTMMANALANLRERSGPGISELFDAISAVYLRGNDQLIEQMKIRLLEGENVGSVSEDIPMVPLQKDLEAQIKKARLTRDWKSQSGVEKQLDLRKKTHLLASRLLHKMNLLNIPWGSEEELDHNPLGNFHEYWYLEWIPDYAILIIEASMWGNTLNEAATNLVQDHLQREDNFDQLGQLLHQVLHGHLPELIDPIARRITQIGNLSQDVALLLHLIPSLILSLRYGDTARLNVDSVRELLNQVFPRVCLLLPRQVNHIADDVAQDLLPLILKVNQTIQLDDNDQHQSLWFSALGDIMQHHESHPIIKGVSIKILLGKEVIPLSEVNRIVSYELSSYTDPYHPALFLQGLVYDGGWLLIQKASIRNLIGDWFQGLTEEEFLHFLPIVRRSLGVFSDHEKKTILSLISGSGSERTVHDLDQERAAVILPALRKLL